ncbi:hypothetical protein QQY24_08755 [Streptomyces sp. TG1A-8]|uniref:hypothetical protein n=1 Tax=Streptomyces sp. TG1A-8 TaxID=3051385 RepID=UPI00265C7AC7|nr:hypothetical protein [Streptomyces sp. TG1A-8]MDO0925495.1 hypothetical protein [Streptomyces sp. TG1A-8]
MLALRLTRAARPAVQLRRLLVAAASAGTGFLLLGALGYALGHPGTPGAAVLRLAWCAVPLTATVHLALAVARTDPGTRPRPGLSAVGLGPARLMAVSALTTALSCTLGSLLALLSFLHLRGDLTGLPLDGAGAQFLAVRRPLPVPATLTLLAVVPATASAVVAAALRPGDPRPLTERAGGRGRFGAYGRTAAREASGVRGGSGTRSGTPARRRGAAARSASGSGAGRSSGCAAAPSVGLGFAARSGGPGSAARDTGGTGTRPDTPDIPDIPGTSGTRDTRDVPAGTPAPREAPAGLPWGVATLAAALAVQAYGGRSSAAPSLASLPGGDSAVLAGWILTALGLVLASPGLTHLCGRLLQSARPGALRLLAGRGLMAEATRIGRPLGVVCAVVSAAYTMTALYDRPAPSFGPLSTLGALVVAGCALAALLTTAVEARQCRADTTAALLRLGAPATTLRGAAALRAAVLLAVFGPLILVIAHLAALFLNR